MPQALVHRIDWVSKPSIDEVKTILNELSNQKRQDSFRAVTPSSLFSRLCRVAVINPEPELAIGDSAVFVKSQLEFKHGI